MAFAKPDVSMEQKLAKVCRDSKVRPGSPKWRGENIYAKVELDLHFETLFRIHILHWKLQILTLFLVYQFFIYYLQLRRKMILSSCSWS